MHVRKIKHRKYVFGSHKEPCGAKFITMVNNLLASAPNASVPRGSAGKSRINTIFGKEPSLMEIAENMWESFLFMELVK